MTATRWCRVMCIGHRGDDIDPSAAIKWAWRKGSVVCCNVVHVVAFFCSKETIVLVRIRGVGRKLTTECFKSSVLAPASLE